MQLSSLNLQRMEDSYLVNSQAFQLEYQQMGYQLVGWDMIKNK